MGTDNYPAPDVEGAVLAAREWEDEIILVGDEEQIQTELDKHETDNLNLRVVHAGQVIEMTDKPAEAAKTKRDASMRVGMNLVRDGEAEAFVSAGNTGGLLAVATLHSVRRIRGVRRPALTAVLPLAKGRVTLLDVGANADCKPEYLYQFGVMGSVYTESVLGVEQPRVALLSNGEEPGKGNALVKEAFEILSASDLNFVGNVEGKELIAAQADVVVADGFTGNVTLKTVEAVARMLNDLIRDELMSNPITILGGLLAKSAFRRVANRIDPYEVGGAPLLGVNGVIIGAHGRSNAWAIRNAIRQARLAVQGDMLDAIKTAISRELSAAPAETDTQ
jgi:glycerol-3-phosphate acyltransferase PlsX